MGWLVSYESLALSHLRLVPLTQVLGFLAGSVNDAAAKVEGAALSSALVSSDLVPNAIPATKATSFTATLSRSSTRRPLELLIREIGDAPAACDEPPIVDFGDSETLLRSV